MDLVIILNTLDCQPDVKAITTKELPMDYALIGEHNAMQNDLNNEQEKTIAPIEKKKSNRINLLDLLRGEDGFTSKLKLALAIEVFSAEDSK